MRDHLPPETPSITSEERQRIVHGIEAYGLRERAIAGDGDRSERAVQDFFVAGMLAEERDGKLVGGFLALNPTGGVLTKQAVVPVAMKALLLAALAWVVMQAVGSTWLGFGLAVGVTGGVLLAMDREIRGYTGQAARMLPAWVRWRTRGRV